MRGVLGTSVFLFEDTRTTLRQRSANPQIAPISQFGSKWVNMDECTNCRLPVRVSRGPPPLSGEGRPFSIIFQLLRILLGLSAASSAC